MPKEKEPTQVIEYDITLAAIEEMRQKYSGMKITDAASDKAVRTARTFVVSKRTAVEKRRVELNDAANKHRRKVNEKAKEITALLLPIEEPLQIEVKRVDDEKEKVRKEKAEKEQARKDDIRAEIYKIQILTGGINLMNLIELQELSMQLEEMKIGDDFMEFTDEAEKALDTTYNAVQGAIVARIKLDQEGEERKAEAEHLKEVAKKQAVDQAKIDEANKKIKAAQKKIDDDKKADEDRKKQEAFEKAATEKAEATAAQKAIDDAAAKEKKDRAEEVEKERKAAMSPDREKIINFADGLNNIIIPFVKSVKAKKITSEASNKLDELSVDIKEQAEQL